MNGLLGYVPPRHSFKPEPDPSLAAIPIVKFLGHTDTITRVRFSRDGRLLASVGSDGQLRVIDLVASKCIAIASNLHTQGINDVAWDCGGRHIYTVSSDGEAACVAVSQLPTDAATLQHKLKCQKLQRGIVARVSHHIDPPVGDGIDSLYSAATAVAAPNFAGQYFLTGGYDEMIRKWDIRKFGCTSDVRAHDGSITSLEFSNDDSLFVTSSFDGYMRLWDTSELNPLRTYTGADDIPLCYACFSPSGRDLLCVPLESDIRVWNLPQPETFRYLIEPDTTPKCIESDWDTLCPVKLTKFSASRERPLVGNTVAEFLSSPGPCVFGTCWDHFVLVPRTRQYIQVPQQSCGVAVWNIGTGGYVGYIGTRAHRGCDITSVATRSRVGDTNLIATSGDFPDSSAVVWMITHDNSSVSQSRTVEERETVAIPDTVMDDCP